MSVRKILIRSCAGCPHSDHSGAFTSGGAIPLCRAIKGAGERVRVPNLAERGSVIEYPNKYCSVLPFEVIKGKRHGTGEIPVWCPLPKD